VRPQDQTNEQWYKEYDTATPIRPKEVLKMDMTQYTVTDSDDLKAKDFIGKSLKLTIAKVDTVCYEATKDQAEATRGVLYFEGKDKRVVLNATNAKVLFDAYGAESDDWIGHLIGLTVEDYTAKNYGYGWVVKPLDVAEPEFDDDVDF